MNKLIYVKFLSFIGLQMEKYSRNVTKCFSIIAEELLYLINIKKRSSHFKCLLSPFTEGDLGSQKKALKVGGCLLNIKKSS